MDHLPQSSLVLECVLQLFSERVNAG